MTIFRGDVAFCVTWFPGLVGGLIALVHADEWSELVADFWYLHIACVALGAIIGHAVVYKMIELPLLSVKAWLRKHRLLSPRWEREGVYISGGAADFVIGAVLIAAGVENFLHGARMLPDDQPWCFSLALACGPYQNLVVLLVFVGAIIVGWQVRRSGGTSSSCPDNVAEHAWFLILGVMVALCE